MKFLRLSVALLAAAGAVHVTLGAQSAERRASTITVRPATLAAAIEELAGFDVRVPYARVVGVFTPRVLMVDTATRLPPAPGHRDRLLVFVESGTLSVPAAAIVGSTVTISGVARTVLGMQVTREVPWPEEITPDLVTRLEIRAAVLARSVHTAEGVQLTSGVQGQR